MIHRTKRSPASPGSPGVRFLWSIFWSAILRFFPLLLLAMPLPAAQQPGIYKVTGRTWVPQVCRGSYCEPGHWAPFNGTAVAVQWPESSPANHFTFLTAAHVVEGEGIQDLRIEINNARLPFKVERTFRSRKLDDGVSVFHLPVDAVPGRVFRYELLSNPPPVGTACWIAGYASGQFGSIKTTVTRVNDDCIETSGQPRMGQSGGPLVVINPVTGNPAVAGIVCGYDTGTRTGLFMSVPVSRDSATQGDPENPKSQVPSPKEPPVASEPVAVPAPSNPVTPQSPFELPDVSGGAPSKGSVPYIPQAQSPPPTSSSPVNPSPVPSFIDALSTAASGTLPWLVPLILGTAGTGGGLAAVAGGVKIASVVWKGFRAVGHVQGSTPVPPAPAHPPSQLQPASPTLPPRDETEARQVLQLRSVEGRSPVHDALFGVLFQDEAENNPNKTLREALHSVNARFNQMAPLSVSGDSRSAP